MDSLNLIEVYVPSSVVSVLSVYSKNYRCQAFIPPSNLEEAKSSGLTWKRARMCIGRYWGLTPDSTGDLAINFKTKEK